MNHDGLWKEIWKEIPINLEVTSNNRWEISNWGRVRSFNNISNGKLLKGSLVEGYKCIRMKFFKPRDEKQEEHFRQMKKQLSSLYKERRNMVAQNATKIQIDFITQKIDKAKKELSQKLLADSKKRVLHYHFLVHRMVAQMFLEQPSKDHVFVGHLDHDKLNNRVDNLKWMTKEENHIHQNKSPKVIESKVVRKLQPKISNGKNSKLTVPQVMLLKKLLKEGKPMKTLVKQFKVSATQIRRISKGENWKHIQAS